MTPDVTVTVTGQSPALGFVLQLLAALVGALVGATVGAMFGYRYAARIEDRRQVHATEIEVQRQAIANHQHHATRLSEALRAFAALSSELAANAGITADRLEDLGGPVPRGPRPLRPRTAVWDGRAADVAHFVQEMTPAEHETVSVFYDRLAAFDAELERAFQLEIKSHGYGRGQAMDEAVLTAADAATARGRDVALLSEAATAAIIAVRGRLESRARQMAEAAQDLYAGTPFAEARADITPPGDADTQQT